MKKWKVFLIVLLVVVMAIACVVGFVTCTQRPDDEGSHTEQPNDPDDPDDPNDPDDPDDPTDDKPEEPAIVYKNDNTLYIILLLVLAAVCVCFAAYIMYTHRKQENQGGGQR